MRLSFRSLVWPVLGFSLVINLLWLAPALFSLQVFDRVLSSQSRETLLVLLIGLTVALAMVGVLEYLRGRLQGVLGSIVSDALSPEIARITLAQAARRHGPIAMEGLRDVGRLRALFSAQGLLAVLDAPWALIFLVVIWLAHPLLGMLASAAAVLLLGLALLNHRLTRKPIEALQRDVGEAQRYLDQAMQNAEVAEAMGMGPAIVHRWQELSTQVAMQQKPAARLSVSMSVLSKVLRQLVQVLLQSAGAYLVIKSESTPGVLVASTMLLGRALAPIEQIVGSWRVLSEGLLAWRRLAPMMAEAAHQAATMELPRPNGVLLAQNLTFRTGERGLLTGVNLALHAGEALAVIGPSGAGKSTLIRLLIGIWSPTAGSVRLDGVDVSKWHRDQLGQHIGYLPQDVELFAGTVAENIARLGTVDADQVVAAARLAGVHELILSLTQGYDTRIDPHSALLSPGQRQRIGLARAVYGEPRLIVLDEPNANLDSKGNEALTAALLQLKGKATVIMVTHRTEALAHADKMLVIEDGRATVFGTPAQVDQFLRQRAQAQARPAQLSAGAGAAAGAGRALAPAAATAAAQVQRQGAAGARPQAGASRVPSARAVPPVEPVTLHNVVSVNGSGTARTGQAVVRAGAVRSAVLAPPAGNPPAIGRSAPGDPTPQMPPAKAGGARSTR
jgi:PrtD family type I secretion system ABC transporter